MNALVIDHYAGATKLPIQTPVPMSWMLFGQLAKSRSQPWPLVASMHVALSRSADAYDPAAPPFAESIRLDQQAYDGASRCRRHHFRPRTSLIARFSSVRSA